MNFKKTTLGNGLTIIGEINNDALSAAVGFFVKTGSRDETSEISGVSHFLEHMLFKGTDKLGWEEVNQAFDRTGAKFNAFTSEENTVYYAAVLPEYLEEITALWAQLMRPALREDDFNLEKNVIKQEIAMYKDLPQFDVFDRARAMHFGQHPCGKSVLGTNQSIDDLAAKQMRDYFQQRYSPGNITVAFSGNFDFDAVCKQIETQCGQWQNYPCQRTLNDFTGTFEKKTDKKENLVRQHICLIQPSVSMQDSNKYAASLLSSIIGDSTGSRYFWKLVDTAIAEEAVMQCESMDGTGAMYSYFKCLPENAEKIQCIVDKIYGDLQANGITSDELQQAKNKILSAITIKSELPMGRLLELGFNWVYLKDYKSMNQTVEKIKSLTVENVNEIISKYKLANFTKLSVGPK